MKRTCILPVTMGAVLAAAGMASAQKTVYWDTNWTTAGSGNSGGSWEGVNWNADPNGASAPALWADGDSAVFSAGTDGTGDWTVNLGSTVATPSILFEEGGNKTISGGTIHIGGGTINSTVIGNDRDLTLNTVLAGTGGLTVAGNGDAITDNGSWSGGECRLGGNNTFSGGLTITAGLVSWDTDANLGDLSNVITLNGGGILCTGASHTTARAIKVGAAGGTIRTYGSTTLTLNGTLANADGVASATLKRIDGGTLVIKTQGTGFAGTIRIGGGDLQLAAPNADWSNTDFVVATGYGGLLTANGTGTAVVNSIDSSADVIINNGTTLDVDTGVINLRTAHWYKTTLGALGKLTSSSGTLTITNGDAGGALTTTDHQIRVELTDSGATPVALVKNHNNSLVLGQPNTYSGGTTINGGRLESNGVPAFGTGPVVVASGGQAFLNSGGTFPNDFTINGIGVAEGAGNLGAVRFSSLATIDGELRVASDARITAYDATDRGTIAGLLTGSAALEKTGGGTITIRGDASGYTGTLTVGAGTVRLANNLGGSVVVNDLACIAGEGTIGGDLTLGEAVGSDVYMDAAAGALGATNLTVNGLNYVHLAGTPTGAPMEVLTYTGTLTLSGATLDDNFLLADDASYRGTPVFANTGSAITLTVDAGADLTWVGGDAISPTFWDTNATPNWKSATTDPDNFYIGDNVLFDDTGLSKTVDLQEGVLLSPASINFNNSAGNDYNLVGDGGDGFTGATRIVKNGAGTVTISGYSHNYTGTVTINEGVLRADSWEMLGYAQEVTINDGGQLEVNGMSLGTGGRHHNLTIAGSGPDGLGAITNNGGGSPSSDVGMLNLTLTADASVGGNGGRFDIGRSGGLVGFVAGNGFTLTKVGTNIVCMRADDTDVRFVIEGGTLKFEDFNTSTGPYALDVNAGTLQSYGDRTFSNTLNMGPSTTIDNDGGGLQTWTGPVNLTGVVGDTVFLSARNDRLMLTGVISGDSNLSANGRRVLHLAGTAPNTYTGDFLLSSTSTGDDRSIVATRLDNQFPAGTVLRFTGSGDNRLELLGTTQTVAGIENYGVTRDYHCIQHREFSGVVAADNVSDLVIDVAEGNYFTYDGVLRDQGGTVNVTKTGPGTQALFGGLIDHGGPTTVLAGRLIVNSDDSWTRRVDVAAGAFYEVNVTNMGDTFENRGAFTLAGTGTYEKTGPGYLAMGWENGATVAMSSGGLIHIIEGSLRLEYAVRTQWAANKGDMLIDAGASFDLWDLNTGDATYPNAGVFIDSLDGEGDVIRTTYAGTSPLTVGVDNGNGDFSGSISNAVGMTHFVKAGTGTQTLRGALAHSGNTTVNGGTLVLADTSSIRFVLTDTGSNELNGTGAVTLDGAITVDASALTVAAGSWTVVDTATLTETYGSNFLAGTAWAEASPGVWEMVDAVGTWTFAEATGVLTLVSGGSYADWIDGFFPGETDPAIVGSDADPDNDSIPNSVEMVIGGDPKDGMDVALLPTIELVADPAGLPAGNWVLFTYRRTDLAVAAGLGIAGEYGVDLVNWAEAQNGVDGVVILEDDNYAGFDPPATADTDRVRIYAPQVLQTLFGRLKVTVP